MTDYQIIEHKLKKFISRYYQNELIKGVILFLALGLLYFLFTVVLEHFIWFNSTGRLILLLLFVGVQLGLLIKFIAIPLLRLNRLFSGIDFRQASSMIGNHFPEVSDKLTNILQLHAQGGDNELTWASINQKSAELKPIPFKRAIDFKKNSSYLKYLAIPVIIVAALFFTGNNDVITSSATRVADYKTEYTPPAPFTFKVMNEQLQTLEQKDLRMDVQVIGEKLPENVSIHYQGKTFYLNQEAADRYSFVFENPTENFEFYLEGNEVRSTDYQVTVGAVPVIEDFQLVLDYPAHTGKKDEVVRSTGNATIPQGTRVSWKLSARNATAVDFVEKDTVIAFDRAGDEFAFAKAVLQPTRYAISTSNDNIKDHERLSFKLDVTRDEYPEIEVAMKQDSIDTNIMYFKGQAADDYGLRSISLIYYKQNDQASKKRLTLRSNKGIFDQFFYTFPDRLVLEGGNTYQFYFEATDNDVVNNFKTARSEVFSFSKVDKSEEEDQLFQKQRESLSNIENALSEQEKQDRQLEELAKEQIEKKNRTYNDQKKLENALKNQEKQEQLMRQQMERVKDNLEKYNAEDDPMKNELKDRMEKSIEEIKENEELLKELQKYQDKLSKEELKDKIEQSQKKSKQQKRTLEQLLELTKRYYVEQKFEQLGRKLMDIAEKQEQQSEKEGSDNKKEDQDKLNEEYKKWEKELEELGKENEDLKKPMDLEFDPEDGDEIKEDQQGASEDLQEQKSSEAGKKQKNAAKKMKKQAQAMAAQSQSMSMQGQQEDAEMLRQILDNLVTFSVEQENLIEGVQEITKSSPSFGKKLRVQKDLEKAFKHVDDSLFALASRNPKISQDINKEITDIYYYLDKTLVQLGEFEMQQGSASQQFALKSANTLAAMLSNSLDQMNNAMSMSGQGMGKPGQGQGGGFQLSDIIQKQESLSKQGKDGKKPGEEGEAVQPGSSGQPGQEGEQGQQGQSGQSGQSGMSGQSGQSGEDGGQQGENGKQGGKDSRNGSGNGSGQGNTDSDENTYRESEEESARIYEIYKQQQELRNQLEDMIRKEGLEGKVGNITDRMKDVERRLIDRGYDRDVEKRMMQVTHELLKLKDAGLFQGKEDQREAERGNDSFSNPINKLNVDPAKYFNTKEILNRQVLPLQPQFKERVKEYFKDDD
ncbi:hypothetical protein BST97_11030 [Nonlabens spongiae]|uniref:Glutamyl-tRNA synthetase n=1 Tax=Nonlabens spongiae TaxID=331648 RepID=A0A1W6MLT8_9FLAO|nr:DUF4175 family protein [Nonlabens spongiae]ARN78476.1 hypothetical protein BST97_11030 [Nonlabens spongiae]